MMEFNLNGAHQKVEQAPVFLSPYEELERLDRSKLRPRVSEIYGQLLASERNGAYSEALFNLDSEDREIKNDAIEYLARHQAYLMDGADLILRTGFDTPEEKAVSDEVNTRLGVIFEKLAKVTH